MLELLYSSGLRAAELLGLDMDRVDFARRHRAGHGQGEQGAGRADRQDRPAVPGDLPQGGAAVPVAAIRRRRRCSWTTRAAGMPYHELRRMVIACAGGRAWRTKVTPHTFRRSCTTELLRGGANMYHVKELLGHESLDTLKHYARLTIMDLKRTHARCHPRERDEGR